MDRIIARWNQKKQTEQAFTLVEILVVIGILAILAAIAIPVYSNYRKTANDAVVVSEMNNVVTEVNQILSSTALASGSSGRGTVSSPTGSKSGVVVTTKLVGGKNFAFINKDTATGQELGRVPVSNDIAIQTRLIQGQYQVLCGWHKNSKTYTNTAYPALLDKLVNGQTTPGTEIARATCVGAVSPF